MRTAEKLMLNAIKKTVVSKEKKNDELYRSPCFFHQPKRPKQ